MLGEAVRVIIQHEETFFCEPLQKDIPRQCTDNFERRYKARTGPKLPFWRTYFYQQTEGDPFFYQQIFLNTVFKDKKELDDMRNQHSSWKEFFFDLCDNPLTYLRKFEEILDKLLFPCSSLTNIDEEGSANQQEKWKYLWKASPNLAEESTC
ncbi:unnamed protein product [Mucor hiemalis]